jgi:hypothetical protein
VHFFNFEDAGAMAVSKVEILTDLQKLTIYRIEGFKGPVIYQELDGTLIPEHVHAIYR